MKKSILTIILLFLFIFSLFGCEKKTVKSTTTTKTNESSETTTKKELTIKYYDGGEMIKTEKYTKDNFNLFTPEKDGFTFLGWFKDEALTQAIDSSNIESAFENNTLSLYAGWETKDLFNVSIKGSIGNKTVINPAFTWKNNYNDSEFDVKVMKGTSTEETSTTKNNYFVCPFLDFNTKYTFIIEGKTSHKVQQLNFSTIQNNDYKTKVSIDVNDPFLDNMVIQRDEPIIINGRGPEKVLISTSFGKEMYYAMSSDTGEFSIEIPAHSASFDPIDIVVGLRISKRLTIRNILIGDVYLFTGQSNMQWQLQNSDYEESDIEKAAEANVRFFTQGVTTNTELCSHVSNGRWFVVNELNDCKAYSALALMGGALIGDYLKNKNVPLGILTAYQGDTNIANWMGKGYYTGTSTTKHLHYNAMIYPLRDASIKGVVWYQGCNNSAAGGDYKDFLLAYFKNYRDLFHNEELKFYVIGLACYDGDSGNNYDFSYVRESQAQACAEDDKAYYISTCDNGDPTYIHPRAKRYIALRIMKSILSSIYGENYYSEGPSYKSHTVSGDTVTIEVNNGEGLRASETIDDFYLAGADGKYYPAVARIEDQKIIVSTSLVPNPVYIKYGFGKSPFTNIFNKDDYSMVPFRTDNHNINIDLLDYYQDDNYKTKEGVDEIKAYIVSGALNIRKSAGSAGYGSVLLYKWGLIAYDAIGFRLTVVGTDSGAKVQFRAIEGPTSETWAYEFVDNFEGERTFECTINDFKCVYNPKDNVFNTQCISYIEVMLVSSGASEITIKEARFVDVDRTKPINFSISSVSIDKEKNKAEVVVSKSLFVSSYTLKVSNIKNDYSNPVYQETKESVMFHFDVSNFTIGIPYYVRAIATNELGETICLNDNMIFYVNDENEYIITKFEYDTQEELDSFLQNSMKVHNKLSCELVDQSVKVNILGDSWAYFIFKTETGANDGMSKLAFTGDFTNFHGEKIVLQLCDTKNNTYSYTMDLSTQKTGEFVINFNQFGTYSNQALNSVFFNFVDYNSTDYVILDNVKFVK